MITAQQVLDHIAKVSNMLYQLGQKDAQMGKSVRPAEVFPLLVRKVFRMDADEERDLVQSVADLWYADYMDGYNTF